MGSLFALFVVVPTVVGTVSWARGRFGTRWWVTVLALVVGVVFCVPICVGWVLWRLASSTVVVVR